MRVFDTLETIRRAQALICLVTRFSSGNGKKNAVTSCATTSSLRWHAALVTALCEAHPRKPLSWSRQKYWRQWGDRCEFTANWKEDGSVKVRKLYRLADTPIIRHQKVKGDYNPFDPRWEHYGEKLRTKRMLGSISYRTELSKLYISQGGHCALCSEPLDHLTGWHDHHLIYKVNGGSDALSNRVLLHPVCHNRVHALGLKVVKPAS